MRRVLRGLGRFSALVASGCVVKMGTSGQWLRTVSILEGRRRSGRMQGGEGLGCPQANLYWQGGICSCIFEGTGPTVSMTFDVTLPVP